MGDLATVRKIGTADASRRRTILETALRLIDREGLDDLTIRRLAAELDVESASLYHHFRNKHEILVGVCHLALSDIVPPDSEAESWETWMLRNGLNARRSLVAHPALIPMLMRRETLGIGEREIANTFARLRREGLPADIVPTMCYALDRLCVVSARQEIGKSVDTDAGSELPRPGLSGEALFRIAWMATIDAVFERKRTVAAAVGRG